MIKILGLWLGVIGVFASGFLLGKDSTSSPKTVETKICRIRNVDYTKCWDSAAPLIEMPWDTSWGYYQSEWTFIEFDVISGKQITSDTTEWNYR